MSVARAFQCTLHTTNVYSLVAREIGQGVVNLKLVSQNVFSENGLRPVRQCFLQDLVTSLEAKWLP